MLHTKIPTKRWAGYNTLPSGSLGLTYCWWQPEIRRSPADMDVSENSGFYPQIIHFNRVFHYKPSIFGTPIFGNTHMVSIPLFTGLYMSQVVVWDFFHQHYLHPHKASPSLVIQLLSQAAEFASFSHDCKESPIEGSMCDLGISNIE